MPVAYSRVMFLGTAGVGKTCFDRALRKLPFTKDSLGKSESQISHKWHTYKEEKWAEVTHEEEIEELAQLIVDVYSKNPLSKRRHSSSSSFEDTKVNEIIKEALEIIKKGGIEHTTKLRTSPPFLHFWDCGNQSAFLEILPAFLTPRTMFFLLFDALKSLHTKLPYVNHAEGNNMTTLDYMLNWMANIHGHLMAYNEDGGIADYPRMFCIGTHGDLLTEEKKKEVKKELEGHYRKKEYSKLIEDTLIIDNTSSGTENEDVSLVKVREEVLQFTNKKLVKMTPLTWVLFRKVLQVLGQNVIDIDTANIIGAASKIPQKEVEYALSFHHDLGAVLFYRWVPSLKDLVIVNPRYFIDTLGKIFSINQQDRTLRRLRSEIELFHQYGILVQPLYAEIWKSCQDLTPNMFIDVLDYFRLAVQVTTDLYSQPHKQYFIPAVLNLCHDDLNIAPPSDSFHHAAPLHITFGTAGFVPPGFFTRFIVDLASKMQLSFDDGVYRNRITFRYKDTNSSGIEHMIVTDHHDVIQINVYRASPGSTPLPPQKVYPKLLMLLKESAHEIEVILSSQKYNFLSSQKEKITLPWAISHVCRSANCPQSTSPHYIVLAPAGQTVESEVYCKNNRAYRELEEEEKVWFKDKFQNTTAVDRFTKMSDQLTSAITPCINGVVNGLHANGLIGFELKDKLINSHIIDAEKAIKLIIELERVIRSSNDSSAKVLETLCIVLKKQNDSQLTIIAESM